MAEPQQRVDVALAALRAVLDDLADSGVRYCHWKSNVRLAESLRGETDLDMLFDPAHADRLLEVAARNGLKGMNPPLGGSQPGMSHYLGFDPATAKIFHLHAHEQLVIGQRGVKNYRLPVEEEFLDSCRFIDGMRIPTADVELGMLSVRAVLKYRHRDAIKDLFGIKTPGIPTAITDEIAWLLEQTSADAAAKALPAAPGPLIAELLERLTADPRAGFFLLRTRLRRRLRPHARLPIAQARLMAAHQLWLRRNRFRRSRLDAAMTVPDRGLSLAFVGADGAGKTTAADDISAWLGGKVSVRRYYLGSKEPSALSRWAYLGFRAFRRAGRSHGRPDRGIGRFLGATRDGLLGLHYVAVAGDRARRHGRSRRDVAGGRVVIFDRFPMVGVSTSARHRLLDGPQVRDKLGDELSGPARLMARWEERRYDGFELPDLLIVLDVDPDVAIDRKPDHSADVVAEKRLAAAELADAIERLDESVRVVRIDANQPADEVRRQIRQAVWNAL